MSLSSPDSARAARRVARRLCAALLLVASAPLAAQDFDATLAQSRNLLRADRLLESGELASGELEVLAQLGIGEGLGEGSRSGFSVRLLGIRTPAPGSRWALTLLAPAVDREPLMHHAVAEWRASSASDAAADQSWIYVSEVTVPEEFQDAAVAVEELGTGRWGAAVVELVEEISAPGPGELVGDGTANQPNGSGRPPDSPSARATPPAQPPTPGPSPAPPVRSTGTRPGEEPLSEVIKLLQPTERPAVGRVRIKTVATIRGIRSAVFYLDGEQVARDDRPPFSATFDLGSEPRARVVRVEALGHNDLKLGEDEITINLDEQPFAVRIGDLRTEAGKTRVTARVTVPPAERLERVDFFKNEELVATLVAAPFEATLDQSRNPSDFVRVVATLENGESVEDARLFTEQVASERIEVNLVEVYAVVSNADGKPVEDLTQDRFELTQGRRQIAIERFALADEVPLVLGLIIDSSESMDILMADTKRAAARFLTQTLLEDDRAFLVDFDTQPRLAQDLSGDLGVLVPALGRLQAGGNTAIYDAVVYSLAQFEREPGRRALVLLTDGRDYGSKFGPKRALPEARSLGVPVYVIAISDLANRMPGAWMQKKPVKALPVDAFLEGFSEGTGGRVFSITDMSELDAVYETINAELRSQYLLAFSTPEPLSRKELESLEVSVTGRGLSTRTVVLAR